MNQVKSMECNRCGTCCTVHQAFVTPVDKERIILYLGITEKDWNELYDDPRWQYSEWRLIRHVNGACAFLKYQDGLAACSIQSVKPDCCAGWQPGPGKKECREGLSKLSVRPVK